MQKDACQRSRAMEPSPKPEPNVVALHGNSNIDGLGVDENVVSFLEALLESAKRGEIIGVAVAFVQGGGVTFEDWEVGRSGRHHLVSAVVGLHHKFIHQAFDHE